MLHPPPPRRGRSPAEPAPRRFPTRLTPPGPAVSARREIARSLYQVQGARPADRQSRMGTPTRAGSRENAPFPDPATLLIVPDHYVFRMLYSQGVPLEALGIARRRRRPRRQLIRARSGALSRALPSVPRHAVAAVARLGLRRVFGLDAAPLGADSADLYFDRSQASLNEPAIPSARAVRALQHRGARDDRKPARSARRTIARSASAAGKDG